ncbi:transcriptional regulator [Streptacidiphilus sp. ASG 303]|uniref:transcriptional regulator n=1 Tax=Streptacidiphilus sp. ASG 303 TaxID=2896847 RepID=UPI001E29222E|nr:transcriptional regulator [Streptacidiphilus sp. ASG 303]MCD0486171.1 transcriptional regulator [Streptacidiphilus sp. ASG 303]
MRMDFGVPPLAEQNRELVEERLKEARAVGGTKETLTIEWRGQPLHVEVVDMPVKDLYYNPSTHRIRAQRSHDPARDRALESDAWSDESQEYLHFLLQALPKDPSLRDPDFDTLLESLRDFKQTDPGLITRDGVLVNGNTRRAALKELGVPHIRVGVLPESCTWADVSAVELSLQLRKDHRRDYTFINRLLAIDEQLVDGRLLKDIAREFHIRTDTCEQDLWILSCLRDLAMRSASGDAQLRLMDFEDAQEKLRELHRRYVKESAVNKEDADLLKESRLAAVALEFSKTDVRLIDPDFQARYLDRILPDSLKPTSVEAPRAVAIPGLNRSVKANGAKVAAARALTDTLLKAKAVEAAGGRVPAAQVAESSRTIAAAKLAFSTALEFAGKDARVRKRRQAVPDRIADACQDIEQCITDLVMARASNNLDEEAYDEAVLKLRGTLGKLAFETSRSIKAPGDGVAWLLEAFKGDSR